MPRQDAGLEGESALRVLESHRAELAQKVADQERLIARLESRGLPSGEARALLSVLRTSLQLARARLAHCQWKSRVMGRSRG